MFECNYIKSVGIFKYYKKNTIVYKDENSTTFDEWINSIQVVCMNMWNFKEID